MKMWTQGLMNWVSSWGSLYYDVSENIQQKNVVFFNQKS